jgi:hypothetical protein
VRNLPAYLRELRECSLEDDVGAMFAIMAVLPEPMNESFSTCVSLLPLNGVWPESMSMARMHLRRVH